MAKRVHAEINNDIAQAFKAALKIRDHREAQLADDKHCRGVGLCEICDEYERLVAVVDSAVAVEPWELSPVDVIDGPAPPMIGKPKSESSERVVPFGKVVSNTLREWKLACPRSDLDLVFPNGVGKIESLANIINRGLIPTQIAAGVVTKAGKAKYTGMHCLRHFYASWLINLAEDGGQGLPPKVVQERMGHSSITLTMDRYGHLFPRGDDNQKTDEAELRLVRRGSINAA
jgi:integrase